MREKLINILSTAGWNLFEGGEQTKREIADHLIASGVTIQKWIPVTERLPEGLSRVLAYVKEDRHDRYAFAICENEKWWDCFYFHPVNVTHWMPLPEPPKGE